MGSIGATRQFTTVAQDRTLNRIANKTRNYKNEQYRIIDEEGNIVLEKRGSEHEVAATVGEKRQFMEGAVAIHNHPAGGTFSSPDLRDFGFGARQIAVAGPDGMYYLTNLKYGQYDAKSGWHDMQEALEKSGATKEVSYLDLRRQAEKVPEVVKLRNQLADNSNKWMQARNSGQPQEVQQRYVDEYNRLQAQYSALLRSEIRKAETAPYHNFYTKNARKYGFEYKFVPKTKR